MELISLEEFKPLLGQSVLLYNENADDNFKNTFFSYSTGTLIEEDGKHYWYTANKNYRYSSFTHWMPLPLPEEAKTPTEKIERFKTNVSKVIPEEIIKADLSELIDEDAVLKIVEEHALKINCKVDVLDYLKPIMYYTMIPNTTQ